MRCGNKLGLSGFLKKQLSVNIEGRLGEGSGVTLRRTYVIGEKGEEEEKSEIEAWREEKDRARGRTPGHTIVESLYIVRKSHFLKAG
jgi:hypothetical protein